MPVTVYAHFRHSTRKEYDSFFRPPVCSVEDRLLYAYRSWRMEMEEIATGTKVRPRGDYSHHFYEFPDGQTLEVELGEGRWIFDGQPVQETWPIPLRRDMVCGADVFRVKPEDDTLFYAVNDGSPGWRIATMGMHIFLGTPSSTAD
jgi:hypothetical protein